MKLFLSWSGTQSEEIAVAFRDWLPLVLPAVEPWMSSEDLKAGSRWSTELSQRLDTTEAGILCVTRENHRSPWMLFEAGALSKTVNEAVVIPYLVGITPSQLSGPLSQFQAVSSDKPGTKKMILDLCDKLTIDDVTHVENAFERHWPKLRRAVNASASSPSPTNDDAVADHPMHESVQDERLDKVIHDLENFHPNPEGIYYIGTTVVRCASLLHDLGVEGEAHEWIDSIGQSIRDDERGKSDFHDPIVDVASVLRLVRFLKSLRNSG